MKKTYIFLFAILLTLGSCTNDIPINRDHEGGVLIMNANIDAQDESHHVYLGKSLVLSLDSLDEGSVKCYVNGELLAEGLQVEDNSARWRAQKRYDFSSPIKAGDVVRLEASGRSGSEEMSCSAEVVVPQAVEFVIYDYDIVNGHTSKDAFFTLNGMDIVGESNYYRLTVYHDARVYFYNDNPQEGEQESFYYDIEQTAAYDYDYSTGEAILNEGFATDHNDYMIFSDNLFADELFSINFTAYNSQWVDAIMNCIMEHESDRVEVREKYTVKLWSLTREYYEYVKALDAYGYGGYEFYEEPVSVPTNVSGGLGFVNVSNSSTFEVETLSAYSTNSKAK